MITIYNKMEMNSKYGRTVLTLIGKAVTADTMIVLTTVSILIVSILVVTVAIKLNKVK